ncbi:hypothetical protein ACNC56_004441 [Escherichia coli]
MGAVRVLFTRQNPVCIVSDYSRTLAQRILPVGLRSLLMREYGDDTTPEKTITQEFIRKPKEYIV